MFLLADELLITYGTCQCLMSTNHDNELINSQFWTTEEAPAAKKQKVVAPGAKKQQGIASFFTKKQAVPVFPRFVNKLCSGLVWSDNRGGKETYAYKPLKREIFIVILTL